MIAQGWRIGLQWAFFSVKVEFQGGMRHQNFEFWGGIDSSNIEFQGGK